MKQHGLLFLFLFLFSFTSHAQGLLLWNSNNDPVGPEGTDVWIRPSSGASSAEIQLYDGDIGGKLDQTDPQNQILVTYSLYRFSDLYEFENGALITVSESAVPLRSVRISSNDKYDANWASVFTISNSDPEGYILRTEAPEAIFEQLYAIRVKEDSGYNQSWDILKYGLKAAIVSSLSNNTYQIRLNDPSSSNNIELVSEDNGSLKFYKVDLFGDTTAISKTRFKKPIYDRENSWAVNIESRKKGIHLFNLKSSDENKDLLWIYDPIDPFNYLGSNTAIEESLVSQCTQKLFTINSGGLSPTDVQATEWYLNGAVAGRGDNIPISFDRRGPNQIMSITPNLSSKRYPKYLINEQDLFINTPPVAELSVPKQTVYTSELLLLSAQNSYDREGQALKYLWYVNNEVRGVNPLFKFTAADPGRYTIKLVVSDPGKDPSCSVSTKETNILVEKRSEFDVSVPPFVTPGSMIALQALIPDRMNASELRFEWNGKSMTDSSSDSLLIADGASGQRNVQLTVIDPSTGDRFNINREIRVNTQPDAVMNIPEVVAPGQRIVLNATASSSSTDTPLSYEWKINEVVVANTEVATLNLTIPGDYAVTLTVDDGLGLNNSTSTITQNLHVNSPPNPVINGPRVSANSVVSFNGSASTDAEGSSLEYSWEIPGDDNASYSGPSITHRFNQSGTYNVRLTVDDGSGLTNSKTTIEQTILINKNPVALFRSPEVIVPGQRFEADASESYDPDGQIYRFEWYLNGVLTDIGEKAMLSIEEAGEHVLSLKVIDNSGDKDAVSLLTKTVKVNAAPVVKWTINDSEILPGKEITFDAGDSYDPDGEITSIKWEFEDGQDYSGSQITRTFDNSEEQAFTIVVTDNEGVANSTVRLNATTNINDAPVIVTDTQVFSNSLDVSLDASSSYDLDSDPLNIRWILPDGSIRNESQFTWRAPSPGIHIIGLVINDGKGLSNSVSQEQIQVLVNRPVRAEVDSLITACSGKIVLFNSSESFDPDGDPFSVNWQFGDGNVSSEPNPSYIYSKPGVYEAKVSMSDGISRKESVAKIPVIIEGSPYATMNMSDTTICVNTLLELDATGSSDPSGTLPSLTWEMGDGTLQSGLTTRHIYTEPGVYTLSLIAEGSGSGACSNISQVSAEIRVIEGPKANFEVPEWVTPGEPVILDARSSTSDQPLEKAEWVIDGDSTQFLEYGFNTTHTFLEPGEYFVTLELYTSGSQGCNSVSLTKTIKVNDPPKLQWNIDDNIAAGEDIVLDASDSYDSDGYIGSYRWYLDGELISNTITDIVNFTDPGFHTLRLEATDNSTAENNKSSLEKEIFVNSTPEAIISFSGQKININDVIPLQYAKSVDADGDKLNISWFVNGRAFTSDELKIDRIQSYTVKLRVDDGRGAANSIDSAIVVLNPRNNIPDLNPRIPSRITTGKSLTLEDINADPENLRFLQAGSLQRVWIAESEADENIVLAYLQNSSVVYEASYPITILPPLEFTESSSDIDRRFNPLNPQILIDAPSVNRPVNEIRVRWYSGDTMIGQGPVLNFTPQPGNNEIRVEITDYQVFEASTISREISVRVTE